MSNVSSKIFSHTHYGVSTIVAVLYAIAWLLGNQVRAEVAVESYVLPAVVVHASPTTSVATLAPVVVTGYRSRAEARFATLEPVVVHASRDVASGATTLPPVLTSGVPVASVVSVENTQRNSKGVVAKVRNWVLAALLK